MTLTGLQFVGGLVPIDTISDRVPTLLREEQCVAIGANQLNFNHPYNIIVLFIIGTSN